MEVRWTAGNCGADGKQRSTHHQETIMNRARRPRTIRRINSTLLTMTTLAAALVADCDVDQPATALSQPPVDGGGTALPSTRPVVIGRMPGWIANYKEVMDEPTRIYRPRQIYVGPALSHYVPIKDRK